MYKVSIQLMKKDGVTIIHFTITSEENEIKLQRLTDTELFL